MPGEQIEKRVLEYYLLKNPLEHGSLYLGKVHNKGQVSNRQLAKSISGKGSTVTLADTLVVLEFLGPSLLEELSRGNTVRIGPFRIRLSISGPFNKVDDVFDPAVHKFRIHVTVIPELIKEFAQMVRPEKIEHITGIPFLEIFTDSTTDAENSSATAGQNAVISGKRLKFDKIDPEQGIFFSREDGTGTPLRVSFPGMVSSGRLVFNVPALESGVTYTVRVNTKSTAGKPLGGELVDKITAV